MRMIPVTSSNVKSVGYDAGNLYVDFLNGGRYRYLDVPIDLYDGILKAESVGKYLNTHIKPTYRYERLHPEVA